MADVEIAESRSIGKSVASRQDYIVKYRADLGYVPKSTIPGLTFVPKPLHA